MATAVKEQATKKKGAQEQPKRENKELFDLIQGLRLNKKLLAELTGINDYTFKMKLAGTNPAYKFTEVEIGMVKGALCEMAGKLSKYCKN
jgi:hypothetical protein